MGRELSELIDGGRLTDMPLIKASLKCNLTGQMFSVWFQSEDEIAEACERLQASLITTAPSSHEELDAERLMAMLQVACMRPPGVV